VSVSVVVVAVLILLATPAVFASQPNQGFAAYEVTATLPSGQHSVLVNESLFPTNKAGFSTLVLQLIGEEQNLTYSRLVNTTTNLLPYLTNLPAKSFGYSNGTKYSVQGNVSSSGTMTTTFRGSKYTLNVYSLAIHLSYGNTSVNAQGTVETFPSALVYSVSASGSGNFEVQALLQATNLPLADPSPQTTTASYVGAGIGVGGIALAAALLARRKDRKVRTQEQKPMYWVD